MVRLLRRLLSGGSSTLGSMMRMGIISRSLLKVQLRKSASPRKHSMTTCCRLGMEKSMALISMRSITVKLVNSGLLSEMRRRKLRKNELC